jgi:hypothetical protein
MGMVMVTFHEQIGGWDGVGDGVGVEDGRD